MPAPLKFGKPMALITWLSTVADQEKEYQISAYHPKRSLAANNYAWVLITRIAESMTPPQDKEAIYEKCIKRYGQAEFVSVRSDIDVRGFFKYYEEAGRGHAKDPKGQEREFTHYKVWKGSSEFDAREMNILLEGIIQEAKDLGIETITPQEKERLLKQMGETP